MPGDASLQKKFKISRQRSHYWKLKRRNWIISFWIPRFIITEKSLSKSTSSTKLLFRNGAPFIMGGIPSTPNWNPQTTTNSILCKDRWQIKLYFFRQDEQDSQDFVASCFPLPLSSLSCPFAGSSLQLEPTF